MRAKTADFDRNGAKIFPLGAVAVFPGQGAASDSGQGGGAVILGRSATVAADRALMQLFSAGGEESACILLPATPGREITAGKASAKASGREITAGRSYA